MTDQPQESELEPAPDIPEGTDARPVADEEDAEDGTHTPEDVDPDGVDPAASEHDNPPIEPPD